MINLSDEQQLFIKEALTGANILVDACIGSGKTTAIQRLCDALPSNLSVLYLTYNRLLKIDAQIKIKNFNALVTNYHGFAYQILKQSHISAGVSDLIQCFNRNKPFVGRFDVLIIDEYQDIELELAEMLRHIKNENPHMQIIAVGDMQQKIYDKTTLDVEKFINEYLGEHIKLEFTRCFRLEHNLAERLGRIWNKKITGVNKNCSVEVIPISEVVGVLSQYAPQDVLCLGSRGGKMLEILNILEREYPYKFNKRTVYASISDKDSGATYPKWDSAIFTTFDSSKGLERKVCVIFDYTESYWRTRISKTQQSYEILRNIFCVASSRGKERIIFADNGEGLLSEQTLSTPTESNLYFKDVDISSMFDFKYKEDVEKCYSLLEIKPVTTFKDEIEVECRDELIDLSPCIGIYQEAVYFTDYDIDRNIDLWLSLNKGKNYLFTSEDRKYPLDKKILILVSLETRQNRYRTQVKTPFVRQFERDAIIERLQTVFGRDEQVQVRCEIDFKNEEGRTVFSAHGFADVVKNNTVYELKFVSELMHEHFLQCACYTVALGLEKGLLWNTRTNVCYEIRVPDRKKFLDAVVTAVTKGYMNKYFF